MHPLFSLITPTYNRGYILWKTIQSVQKQIFPYWELFVLDDGSTDDTEKVVAQFQKDPRIRYLSLAKGNATKARNAGLEKAKGEFIVYLDSDDQLYENFLSVTLEHFKKNKQAIFSIPNYNRRLELYNEHHQLLDFIDSNDSIKESLTLSDIYHWKEKGCGTGLVHKRIAIEKGIRWDESLMLFEDWDFKLQLGRVFPNGFMHIPYVLFEYLQQYGGDGVCSNTSYGEWAEGFDRVYKKHKDDPLMKGQEWYPDRVKKYKKMQEQVENGEIPEAVYKYFPEYGNKKASFRR